MNEITRNVRGLFDQGGGVEEAVEAFQISAKHYFIEWKQAEANPDKHHPIEKASQIRKVLAGRKDLTIYEVYGGFGFCTQVFEEFGTVVSRTREDGDAWHVTHAEIASKRQYDVVDIDGYGYPSRILASGISEILKPEGTLFVTIPITGANYLNRITEAHLKLFYGCEKPDKQDFIDAVGRHMLAYHRIAELVDCQRIHRIWRMAFHVKKVPATELYGVRNRPGPEPLNRGVVPEPLYFGKTRDPDLSLIDMFGVPSAPKE